ncbi:hypothetical protein GCM10020000_36080 [Streptomyces olivoverticillatus]
MHNPRAMDVAQRLCQTGRQPPHTGGVQRAVPLDALGERGAGDIKGGHPGTFTVRVGIDDGRGECSAHPPRSCDFLPEPRPEFRVHRVLGVHHLDGEPQPARRTRQMHHAHATRAELSPPAGTDSRNQDRPLPGA